MTDDGPSQPAFVPTFSMPIVAPAPSNYPNDASTYYADVTAQSNFAVTEVEILPEQTIPPANPLETKGLFVTISSPDAVFQFANSSSTSDSLHSIRSTP